MLLTITDLESMTDEFDLFRVIFNQITLPYAILGVDGRPVRVNGALEMFLGYNELELKKITFRDITFQPDRDLDDQLFRETIEGARDRYIVSKRWIKKSGVISWGVLTVSAIKNDAGNIVALVAAVNPIEESAQAGSALRYLDDSPRLPPSSASLTPGASAGDHGDHSRNWVTDIIYAFHAIRSPIRVGIAFFLIVLALWLFSGGGADRLIDIINKKP